MAELVLGPVAKATVSSLIDLASNQLKLALGWKGDLASEMFCRNMRMVRDVLRRADEKNVSSNNSELKTWLQDLGDIADEADYLLEEVASEMIRRDNNPKWKTFSGCFLSNPLIFWLRIATKAKDLKSRLAVLNANATSFWLQSRLSTAVDAPMANPEQTNSFLSSQVVGREEDDLVHDLALSLAGFDEHQPLEAVYLDKMKGEKITAVINFVLELPSAVLEQQVSSNHKHGIALALMLLSFVALFVCFAELVLRRRRCGWKWRSQRPRYHQPFCSAFGVVGFVCAICQCIFTAVNYALVLRHVNIRIQVAVMPIIFALVQLCCTFRTHSNQSHSEADQA